MGRLGTSGRGRSVIIVGAGIFGVTAALELRRRGYDVSLLDPGPLPHPLATSTDISKMVRSDYGDDELFTAMAEESIQGWRRWNREWRSELYHNDGFLIMTSETMRPGTFEHDSFELMKMRGVRPERMSSELLKLRFPAWASDRFVDGFLSPMGGWVEADNVVARLIEEARAAGVSVAAGTKVVGLIENGSRVGGVVAADGGQHMADYVVVAAGPWTPTLLPDLQDVMWPVGQPVLYFRPDNPADYRPPRFLPWAADISSTGWYGFPATEDGVLKVSNHGPGRRMSAGSSREVPPAEEGRFRRFLQGTFPSLADAPLISSRYCLYCDTWDGNFLIDHDPDREGLLVATGGSGHGFKFAPVLGNLIADVLEGAANPYASRFAWRARGERKSEPARHLGS